MALVTGSNLLNSVIDSTGVGMGTAVKLVTAARLQQMIDAGIDGGISVALVLSAASSEIRGAVPVLTNLASTVTAAKDEIEGGGSTPTSQSIDTGTLDSPVTFDAGTGSFDFTDDATVLNNVVINNFSSDDHITVSNAQADSYFFSNDGADVHITFNNEGVINAITLTGVVSSDSLVSGGEASFETAIGFDAFGV